MIGRINTQNRFNRTDTSIFHRWWWTIDRVNLFILLGMIVFGAVLVTAASPPIAKRLNFEPYYFVTRQHIFLLLSCAIMLTISFMPTHLIRRLSVLGFLSCIGLMMLLPIIGFENKGAVRWIHIAGVSLQPSEILKPCFAVVIAWIFSERHKTIDFPGYKIGIGIYGLVAALLLIQPDFGMTVTVTGIFAALLVLAGVSFGWVALMGVGGIGLLLGAYNFMPHVQSRIDRFLNPENSDNYQVGHALTAFENGGLFGTGPGEGVAKWIIPDSHTDFVFAVVGEEFGLLIALIVVLAYAVIVLRGFFRIWKTSDLFVMLAVSGLVVMFGLQSIINMGVAVNLLPAKGMTLPFLSYGGSSLIGTAIGMGMMLGLTRKQYGTTRRRQNKFQF